MESLLFYTKIAKAVIMIAAIIFAAYIIGHSGFNYYGDNDEEKDEEE